MDPEQNAPVTPNGGVANPDPALVPIANQPVASESQPLSPVTPLTQEQPLPREPIEPFQPPAAQQFEAPLPQAPMLPQPTVFVGGDASGPQPQAPQPVFSPIPVSSTLPGRSKKKLIAMIVAILLAASVIGGGAFYAIKLFSGISLETYNGDGYSVLVPKGYEKKESGTQVSFEEKEGEEKTHSGVVVVKQTYPKLTDIQKKAVQDSFEETFKFYAESAAGSGQTSDDIKVERVTHKGKDALRLSAKINQNGKKVYDIRALAIIGDEYTAIVGVTAHSSDPGVAKKIDAIIESFTVK